MRQRFGIWVATVACLTCSSALSSAVRQVYAPMWKRELVERYPCLMSVATPPAEEERCIPWTRRESAGPAFHAATGIIVVGGGDGVLRGLSVRDGSTLYETALPGHLVTRPALSEDSAYFGTTAAQVLRTDISSGEIRWAAEVDAEVLVTPVVHEGTVYVITGLETVFAFDAASGAARWSQKHPLAGGISLRGQATPLLTEATVDGARQLRLYVGHSTGKLTALDAQTGRPVDEFTLASGEGFLDVDADTQFVAGQLIAASHQSGVWAIDPKTRKPRWRWEEKGIVRLASGPGRVIAAGAGKVVGLDPDTGQERWRFTFARGAPTQVVVSGGKVHVGSDRGALYVLDLLSGEPLQYFGSSLGFAAAPEQLGDLLLVTSIPGTLYALSKDFAGIVQAR